MTRDVSPVLDRHTQERLGQKLKERLDQSEAKISSELDALLSSLRASELAGRPSGPNVRR